MAVLKEDEQARETYEPVQGAEGDSPAPDAQAASSAEPDVQESASEQAPPPTSQSEPERYNVPPKERWDELVQKARDAERQRDEALRLAQDAIQRVQTPQAPTQPAKDLWAGKIDHPDPATAQFWQEQKALLEHAVARARQETVQELTPVINAGMAKLAQADLREFRKENPDIKPGSEEERQIVAYMNGQVDGVQHPLESAKRNVLFDKLQAQVNATKSKQASVPQKRAAAATESSAGIPAGAGLPGKPGDWRERVGDILEKGGSMKDAAKALFERG